MYMYINVFHRSVLLVIIIAFGGGWLTARERIEKETLYLGYDLMRPQGNDTCNQAGILVNVDRCVSLVHDHSNC